MMEKNSKSIVTQDLWQKLTRHTDARICLGRAGTSIPVSESLKFKLAHARAKDAVLQPFDRDGLAGRLQAASIPCRLLSSAITNRSEYLTRPDKGRMLDGPSREKLACEDKEWDLGIVVCDGLSTRAVHENCADLIISFRQAAQAAGYRLPPVQIVENGRVAIGDEIAERLKVKLVIVLIGERPGLSSPNSLGIYLTYNPRVGITDEARNCISNVREKGLPIPLAVQKLSYLVENALAQKKTGVMLKDKMSPNYIPFGVLPKVAV